MYKLFLTLRYLRKRFIAYFAIAAVALCTWMVVMVMSVMGGFLDELKDKARGLLGDIIVDNRSYSGFPLYEEFIAEVSNWPEVAKATPVLYTAGLLRFHGTPNTHLVTVVGLRLEDVYEVNAFKESLFYEKYYPGTTHLEPQRQPMIGIDPDAPPVELRDHQGEPFLAARPLLPPKYQEALEQSWAAGEVDDETPESEWTRICNEAGIPPIVGEYAMADPPPNSDAPPLPQMAGDPWPGLIIGRDIIAERLPDGKYQRYWLYPRGCLATVTLVPMSTTGGLDTPMKQPFRYVDDSRTGIYEIDSRHVYCQFKLLQKLMMMDQAERVDPQTGETIGTIPARCSQIQVKLREEVDGRRVDPQQVAARLEEHYHRMGEQAPLGLENAQLVQSVKVMTWEESQAHIIAPVEKERQLVVILFGVISLVAAVLVLCILYMIVLQKTRDIGIIKSIGGSSGGVAAIFVSYGAAVGIVGSLVGATAGVFSVTYINEIHETLVQVFGWRVWDRSVYSFDHIPNTVRPEEVVAVVLAAIAASVIGALAAAWRAGQMQPVEALRHE